MSRPGQRHATAVFTAEIYMSEFGARIHRNFAQLEKRIETICTWCHASRHVAKCYELSCSRQSLHSNSESVVRRTLTRGKRRHHPLVHPDPLHVPTSTLWPTLPNPPWPAPVSLSEYCPSSERNCSSTDYWEAAPEVPAGVPDGGSSSSSSSSGLSSNHGLEQQPLLCRRTLEARVKRTHTVNIGV